jgi:hypothetical protein
MPWIKIELSDTDIVHGRHTVLQTAFTEVFDRSWGNDEIALFGSKDFLKRPMPYFLHVPDGWVDSLSPLWVGHSFLGVSCSAPAKADVALLVGTRDAWRLVK